MTDDTHRLTDEMAELRRRLAEVEQRLERAQRIDSLGHVMAGVVHDLSNLITPLVASSTLLAYSIRPGTAAATLATEVRTTAERSAALVRQGLGLLRGEPPRPTPVNLNTVLLEMRPLLERLVGSDVTVAMALGERLGDTLVDRGQLEQAILDLAANARDAMPSGGLLTIRTENVGAPLPDGGTGSHVELILTDTGTGMTPDALANALQGLFTTKGRNGTGLGLAGVQRFATSAGGRVTACSRADVGTTITLRLPRVP